jgi:hypothetical protein
MRSDRFPSQPEATQTSSSEQVKEEKKLATAISNQIPD